MSPLGFGNRADKEGTNVLPKTLLLQLATLLLWSGAWVLAKERSDAPDPNSDPVMQALGHGVDHLDGASAPATLQHRGVRYRIEDGDVLDLQFQLTPEFNQTVTVQPDGYITLKEVGDVHVEGSDLPAVRHAIQQAYGKILANPVVSVDLKEFEKPYFLAFGQVARPGKYDLRGNTTVSAAVAMAGGFTTSSKHSQVLVFRRVNDSWSSVTQVDLKHMLKSRNLAEDLSLHPGDMVYVPQNLISKVKPFVPNPTIGTYQSIP